jgi:hypothetical protein
LAICETTTSNLDYKCKDIAPLCGSVVKKNSRVLPFRPCPSPVNMRFVSYYSFAASAAFASALVVPARTDGQVSIENSKKHDDYDLAPSANFAFSGITTFAHLPTVQCLTETGPVDDILIVGFPFDTATSYRTGTRFGPNAVRQGSRAASLAFVCPSCIDAHLS